METKNMSRKDRRRLAKERGEKWGESALNERPTTELKLMQAAKERKREAKSRAASQRIQMMVVEAELARLLNKHQQNRLPRA